MTTKRAGSLPFLNPVGDGLELMKKMWGFAGLPSIPTAGNLATMAARIPQQLPSMLAPTLDVNELEKRIADLRAVEQWLELNAGILRTTIQTLEVQRATIATLKGIGGAMWAPMLNKPGASPAPPPEVALGLAAMKADESKAAKSDAPPALPSATRKPRRRANKNATARSATAATASVNPAAWWNTLQDQLTKIAATTASPAAPRATKSGKKAAKRRTAKPR